MSISTRIPTGPIHRADFCYAPLYELLRYSNGTQQNFIDPDSTEFFSCASAKTPKKGPVELKDSDFQAFCCDGHIVGWTETDPPSVKEEFAFEDLTCCRLPASRTHMADLNVPMTCSSDSVPTPLGSLAATTYCSPAMATERLTGMDRSGRALTPLLASPGVGI